MAGSDMVTINSLESSFFYLNSSKMNAKDDLFGLDIFYRDHKHHGCIVKLSPVSTVEEVASLEDTLARVQN